MVKITDKDELVNSEDLMGPRLVFSDDAMVVDYLNNLLASAPTIDPDSGEIHFVHLPTWARHEQTDGANASNTFVNKALFFGSEHSKAEVEGLRNENEHLKFKTELAEIDAQVLRSENDNLKLELACVVAQHDEAKSSLDSVLLQNNELLSRINSLQNQIDLSERSRAEADLHAKVDSAFTIDTVTEKEAEPVSERVVPDHCADAMIDQKEEPPLLDRAIRQENIPNVVTIESTPNPAFIDQKPYRDDKICSGVDRDTAFISRPHAVNQNVDQNTTVFSRESGVSVPINRGAKPASKIIKQHQVKENPAFQTSDQTLTITPLHSLQNTKINTEPDRIVQQHIAEPATKQADVPPSNADILHLEDADGIDLEPAPAPKVVVRKNVKNYEDLQKETDPSNAVKAGHAIIL